MHEILHGLFALPFAYIIWIKTGSARNALLTVVISYLIDIDHWFDYLLYHGLHINFRNFFSADYFNITGRYLLLFHGWEYLLILFIIAHRKKWNSLWWVLFFAYAPHILLDLLNIGNFIFYSFIYRAINGFYINT